MADVWERLESFSEVFTCYSSAIATWTALEYERWAEILNPGLRLTLGDAGDGLFGFSYFPSGLRATLGLARVGSDDPAQALEGVLEELERSGRVIVAGDAFHQPWHVAFERRHLPHWYVVATMPEGPSVIDPFGCRNQLGVQLPTHMPFPRKQLAGSLPALPGDDPIYELRESLAFGDDSGPPERRRFSWFVRSEVGPGRAPVGVHGAEAVSRLAGHFREHGQEPVAYRQADDLWAIGRHRAFVCRYAAEVAERDGDPEIRHWLEEHGAPLTRRWGHVAPLIMQATLALGAGRSATTSLPDTLEALAALEHAAARNLPAALG